VNVTFALCSVWNLFHATKLDDLEVQTSVALTEHHTMKVYGGVKI
jgi:hypothetical protein